VRWIATVHFGKDRSNPTTSEHSHRNLIGSSQIGVSRARAVDGREIAWTKAAESHAYTARIQWFGRIGGGGGAPIGALRSTRRRGSNQSA
jgi:hypothetical protein